MNWIVGTALRFRVLVVAAALLLLGLGQQLLPQTPLDVFPEFAPPLVEIQTEAPGLSSEDVESLVTVPIENAVNGTPWMSGIRSKSVLGLSSVVLLFDRGVDLMAARQLVQERLNTVLRDLPQTVGRPVLLSPLSSTSRVLKVGLWSSELSQADLTVAARWKIRPRLMAIAGVANVAIWGQRDPQLQVLVEPERLRAHGISLDRIALAAGEATAVGGGGFIDTPNQRLAVAFDPAVRTAADLGAMVVDARNGATLRLRDVADVVEGTAQPVGDAIINDVPGILLIVEKQPWGNTLQVTHEIEEALEALRPALSGIEIDSTIFRPATFVEMSLANLRTALLIGAVLVAGVLGLFLFEWRTAVISLLAMPLSLVAAALVIRYQGGSIDTMVLAGLIIALGEVVDDAIIDVENILRRLRLEREVPNPRSAFRVVLAASLEVRSAVVYASLIVAVVLVPVFLLPGLSGAFFRPLALAYILAILASMAVALTVTPALCLLMLPNALDRSRESPLVATLRARYRALLPRLLGARTSVGIIAGGSVLALVAWPLLGQEFLPHFKEYDFLMHWLEKPSVGIEAMDRITIRASKELRSVPGVRNFGSHIGRAEVADEVVGPEFTELWISLDPSVEYEETVAAVQEVVDGYPGLYRDLLTYLRERIKEVLTGASATIVVRLYGDDLATLRDVAQGVRAEMAQVEGIAHLKVEHQTLVPQIGVRVRPEAAALHGVSVARIHESVETMLRGRRVGQLFQDQRIIDVVVWGAPETRSDPIALGEILIPSLTGAMIPLRRGRRDPDPAGAEHHQARSGVEAHRRDLQQRGARAQRCGGGGRSARPRTVLPARRPPGVPRRAGRAARRKPKPRAPLPGRVARRLRAAPVGLRFVPPGDARVLEPALRAGRRRRCRRAERRDRVTRFPRRLRHRLWHRGPQRADADEPLSPSRAGGGRRVRARPRDARCRGAPRPHSDDRAHDRPRARADRNRRRAARLRDRTSDGAGDRGRSGDLDDPQPLPDARAHPALGGSAAVDLTESSRCAPSRSTPGTSRLEIGCRFHLRCDVRSAPVERATVRVEFCAPRHVEET